jgi:2-methylcitrate dehydratase PrpD
MASATTSSTIPVSKMLAEFCATATFERLPQQVVADTERAVLDWLGSAMAGSLEAPARMAQAVIAKLGHSNDSTVFSAGRSSAAGAALANGVASHLLELDDVHKGSTLHPGAPIIPAALAISEREHRDGKSFLLGVALGYEAALRIGEAVNPDHYRFWHPTGTAATFGAAVAAGSLLKLNTAQMLDALGSAGTQASGLWEFNADGTMSKHLHPGKAAFNGILAADLARAGFTGASRILEGDRGFFRATAQTYDPTRVTNGLGDKWKISENCFKLYSCCGHTHTAIDAALAVRAKLGWKGSDALGQIRELDILTYNSGYQIVKEMNPPTAYRAQFSMAYVVAAALLEGRVDLQQFSPDRFDGHGVIEPSIVSLLPRLRIIVSDELSALYPKIWPARFRLTLKDGRSFDAGADYPRGSPENPVATEGLRDKFRSLIEPRFGIEVAQNGLHAVDSVLTTSDMSTVFRTFG